MTKIFFLMGCFLFFTISLFIGFCVGGGDEGLENEYVIILHGLGRSKASMEKIEGRLKEEGYQTVNYGYPSTDASIEELARIHVARAVNQCKARSAKKIHFVTHSLGGILVRLYLQDNSIPKGCRVVMLSPPNRGSELVDKLKDVSFYQWITGPAGQQLGTDENSLPNTLGPIDVEVGIITGNRSYDPWFSPLIPGNDDGKVSVERARLEEMKGFIVVESGHAFIMRNPEVIDQIVHFLKQGRFRKLAH